MSRIEGMRALCVSIHDVAPSTWAQCTQLLDAVHAVAQIPVSLLVVPDYHRRHLSDTRYEYALGKRLERGDELVLHGYSHLDEAAPATGWRERFTRELYTRSEGEFYAIGRDDARHRLELGCAWFQRRGWPLHGFVAPAWLMGPGAWAALADFPFCYTTTLRRFYLLPQRQALSARSLVWTVGSGWRRAMSKSWNGMLVQAMAARPLVRVSLHPADAAHPDIVRQCQALLAGLLETREAMTKAAFTQAWRAGRRRRLQVSAHAGSLAP